MAQTNEDRHSIENDTTWYDPRDVCAPKSGVYSASTAPPSQSQAENAQIVIGIAKTNNLGKQGALIGLMVALAESSLLNYANSSVPVSLSIPHQAVGSDHDSVGIFQQRPSTGWSTIATGQAALSNRDAVAQLMDPRYASQAFFGSPPGSNAPSALSKGLQNVPDWQSREPWLAAQKVQASFDSTGSNYRRHLGQAQSLLDQYWDSSPAIPLPVQVTGGSPSSSSGSTPTVNGCAFFPNPRSLALRIYKGDWA